MQRVVKVSNNLFDANKGIQNDYLLNGLKKNHVIHRLINWENKIK